MTVRTAKFQADQITAAFINQINNNRFRTFQEAIEAVEKELGRKLAEQDVRILEALKHIENVREFVANPENILGSIKTKHGEIAEQVEVGIRNAKAALRGEELKATFDGVGRTAPEDYRIGDMLYQSKFINGTRNSLEHVLEHMKKYDNFRVDADNRYHIPKDQFEIIKKIMSGEEVEGLSSRSIEAIRKKVMEIEELSGVSLFQKIEASNSSYSGVQIGKVGETLEGYDNDLNSQNEDIKQGIKEDSKNKSKAAEHMKDPTMGEAMKAGAIGAGVGAAMKFGTGVYRKFKDEDKRIFEFDGDDWKEIGLDVGKGAARGGITGTAIYGLTNFAYMPAPVAGGYVSSTFAVASIIKRYKKGEMEIEDLLIESESVCIEGGITMACAIIGQAVIPVPIVGAIVGSVVGSMISNTMVKNLKSNLNEKEKKLIEEYNNRYKTFVDNLKEEEQRYYRGVMDYFLKIQDIEKFIFDPHVNSSIKLEKSAELAETMGVDEKKLLRSVSDVDALFM